MDKLIESLRNSGHTVEHVVWLDVIDADKREIPELIEDIICWPDRETLQDLFGKEQGREIYKEADYEDDKVSALEMMVEQGGWLVQVSTRTPDPNTIEFDADGKVRAYELHSYLDLNTARASTPQEALKKALHKADKAIEFQFAHARKMWEKRQCQL